MRGNEVLQEFRSAMQILGLSSPEAERARIRAVYVSGLPESNEVHAYFVLGNV